MKRKKSEYHHPDLRTALLDAAAKMIRTEGLAAFSLRGLAKQAGVSHAAPYRHFKNKEEILANLILEGHRRLQVCLAAARDAHPDSPPDQLAALARSYLAFARANPEYLHVMFSRAGMEAAMALGSKLNYPQEDFDTFGVLESTVKACQAGGWMDPRADSGALSFYAWATVHGLASLANEGLIAGMAGQRGMDEATALEAVVTIMRASLRSPP
jgi:AcrR family transcriptional regulator